MKFFLDNLYLFAIAAASGGMLLWPLVRRGSGAASVNPAEATRLINTLNAIVVDVRDEAAFAGGSVTGARNLPADSLAARASELQRFKERPVIVVCASGQQSTRALAVLKEQGFADVRSLAGGLAAWTQAGLPLVASTRGSQRNQPKDSPRGRQKGGGRDRARGVAANAPVLETAAPPDERVKEAS